MIKNTLKDFFWLGKVGLKTIKIKIFSIFKKNYSDPYRLLIKVTDLCNYRCKTCGIWKKNNNNFISEKKQKEIISKYKDKLFFLSITGGEPFLCSEKLFSFLVKIKKENKNLRYLSINTNCSQPKAMKEVITKLMDKFPTLRIYIGIHYIPNQKWGLEKTGVENAYQNYQKTVEVLDKINKKFKKRFSYYKVFTISKKQDLEYLRADKNLWINFAVINEFYNNEDQNYIEKLTKKEKIDILEKYLHLNSKNINFLAKSFFLNSKRILKKKRKIKCFAGINRIYIDCNGEEFICSRKLKKRSAMSTNKCKNCWTACEANFDLINYFFAFPFFDAHQKDLKN